MAASGALFFSVSSTHSLCTSEALSACLAFNSCKRRLALRNCPPIDISAACRYRKLSMSARGLLVVLLPSGVIYVFSSFPFSGLNCILPSLVCNPGFNPYSCILSTRLFASCICVSTFCIIRFVLAIISAFSCSVGCHACSVCTAGSGAGV